MAMLSKNFDLREFTSLTNIPDYVFENLKGMAIDLEVIRAHFGGKPLVINSGYRTKEHNARIGGVPNSQHIHGRAVDFRIPGVTDWDLYNGVEQLIDQGKITQGGLGLYAGRIHYDTRGTRARWIDKSYSQKKNDDSDIIGAIILPSLAGYFITEVLKKLL